MRLLDLTGVGEKTVTILEKQGITSLTELLYYFPRTYRTFVSRDTAALQAGEWVMLQGTITRPTSHHTAHTTTQLATFRDQGGTLALRWFNAPYITRSIQEGKYYDVRGKIEVFGGRSQIVNPELHILKTENGELKDELVPIYTPLGTLKSGVIRRIMASALVHADKLTNPLSLEIENRYDLISLPEAIRSIHFPGSETALAQARRRLGFEELYAVQKKARATRELFHVPAEPLHLDMALLKNWQASLPYTLTSAQDQAITAIMTDLQGSYAMHRLLQGEVGSGKTVVAAAAALAAWSAGKQTLILAPTQILAEQLQASLIRLLPPTLQISLITRTSRGNQTAHVVVGTQALLESKYHFGSVGLVIVDEQHRFGVEQRLLLTRLTPAPPVLLMTATPIPRTLSMTLFAGLDITRLDVMPSDRLPVKTLYVEASKRASCLSWIQQEVQRGNQAFFVVPLIELALDEEETSAKSVASLEIELRQTFPHLVVDIMHGRMKAAEKTAHLQAFRDGVTQILVATSMIEVGIDIPEANLIVIENAERFGLAQLHQLRGRVGRGGGQGYCLIFSDSTSEKAKKRLAYFVRETDGAKLAEYDLKERGPGELFGTAQHGFFELKIASLYDTELLHQTAEAAGNIRV
jgi:ATP-dependent DNA helicase RecG